MNILLLFLFVNILSGENLDRAKIDSINSIGKDYIFSHIDYSISLYKEVISKAKKLGYTKGVAKASQNLAIALYLKGDYEKSIKTYLDAIRIYEALQMNELLAEAYGELGYQMKRRNLSRALDYMRMAIAIAQQENANVQLSALYDNYGVLQEMKEDADSALFYYEQSLKLKKTLNDSIGIPYSLNNIAGIYLARGDFNKSAKLLQQSDRYRAKEKNNYGRIVNNVLWGDWFYYQEIWDSAAARYENVVQIPNAFEQRYLVGYCFNQLALIYEKQHDFEKAYNNLKNKMIFNDSLINIETSKHIADLEVKFETEKKERQLAKYRLKMSEYNRKVLLFSALTLFLILISSAIYLFQRMKRKQLRKKLKLQNILKQKEYEQKIANEKMRISQELHDNIGAQLTFLTSSLDNIAFKISGKLKNKIENLSNFGKETMNDLRNTVWAIKQEDGNIELLLERLNELKIRFNENIPHIRMEIKNKVNRPLPIPSGRMLNILRIIQEAVQNAVKHGEVSKITVNIWESENLLNLSISDDGKGFDPAKVHYRSGLANMRRRCMENAGTFDIRSSEFGTTILCKFSHE